MSQKIQIQTIFFDLDGTLIDTEPTAALTVQKCFEEWNIQVKPADTAYVTGRTWDSALEFLFQQYTPPLPYAAAKKQILSRYREELEKNLITVPGSVQAVETLSKTYPLALVSGSERAEILWALKKLKIDLCFQTILGAEDYPRSKPHPDGYLKAAEILQANAPQCLAFEDSTAGISSARAAGFWVAAVTSTNHFQQSLTEAHWKVPDLTPINLKWIHHLSFD